MTTPAAAGGQTTEYRRILLDGAIVQVVVEGAELVAADGRRASEADAVHVPPVVPDRKSVV